MNHNATKELLTAIEPYVAIDKIDICCENEDYKGRPIKSDYVAIVADKELGFEVFDNEIIVFFYGDHCHFEDYSSELENGEPDYIGRAKVFLIKLLRLKVKSIQTYKGSKVLYKKSFLIYPDGEEESIGYTCYILLRALIPFLKKTKRTIINKYDKDKGIVISYPEKTEIE